MLYHLNQAVYELTLRCNLNCKHCGSNAGLPRQNELSLAESLNLIRELNDLGTTMVTLIGGEPFLNPNWLPIGKAITDYGIRLAIITNGFHLPDSIYSEVARLDPYEIAFSLDGNREIHDRIRNTGSFDQVLANLHRFQALNVPTGVITTVSKTNLDFLDEILAVILHNGIDAWQIQAAIPMGRMQKNVIITNTEYKRVVDFIYRVRTLYQKYVFLSGADCMGLGAKALVTKIDYSNGNCAAGKNVVGIRSNGDIVGCLSMMDDAYVEGNLRQHTLKEIWTDEHAFSYNRHPAEITGQCRECSQRQSCKAGCKSMNIAWGHPNGSPYCMQFQD
jgi:radical SAM protein with 4Fe4S-binding SPASM domain